jgi:hypothetical protein
MEYLLHLKQKVVIRIPHLENCFHLFVNLVAEFVNVLLFLGGNEHTIVF